MGGEIGVSLGAVEQLADDEQRPPLPDQLERARDGAVLVVALPRNIVLEDDLLFESIAF
jgi:hypothetical protein